MALIFRQEEQHWECPACDETAVTVGQPNRFHDCPRMHGMSTPMVPEGVAAKVEAHEREDYIGTDRVQLDAEGRPIMNVTVTRNEGEDMIVFAPAADVARTDVLEPEPPHEDLEALRQARIAEAVEAHEKLIRKVEKEREHLGGAEASLECARRVLAELEQI